jgi:uncharacterized protein with PQ loop repeat
MSANAIGWIATATFAASYVFKRQSSLRIVQAMGASLWLIYGIVTKAPPVIVANLIVVAMALLPLGRSR